jgi:uroporphyrinogen-III synthase
MPLIVTRPRAQAAALVQALRAMGCDAVALPLIDIAPPQDAAPVRAAWGDLPRKALVMFVSANAVEQFFALRPQGAGWPAGLPAAAPGWPLGLPAAATGPGTAAALLAAGVPAADVVAPPDDGGRFDSEALWAQIESRPWAGAAVLVVRGEAGRDWLAERFAAAGAQVAFVAAYRRLAPQPDAQGLALLHAALARPQAHAWLFSSSEAVQRLGELAAGMAPSLAAGAAPVWARASALATHERIADAARRLGFDRVVPCGPGAAEVAVAAQALLPPAPGSVGSATSQGSAGSAGSAGPGPDDSGVQCPPAA